MANGNGFTKWAKWIPLILTLSGLLWATAVNWEKMEQNSREDKKVHPVVEQHSISIAEQRDLLQGIKEGVDEIKAELRK